MAENILLKVRIAGIAFADPITTAAGLATATWEDQPLTLRDDEVSIVEDDPDEKEVFSHENDSAEDYDITGKGLSAKGSFIKMTRAQMVDLIGGATVGVDAAMKFHKSARKLTLNKAIKFTLKSGDTMIAPNAKGFVLINAGLGVDGVQKYPWKFKLLQASAEWDCDLVY